MAQVALNRSMAAASAGNAYSRSDISRSTLLRVWIGVACPSFSGGVFPYHSILPTESESSPGSPLPGTVALPEMPDIRH